MLMCRVAMSSSPIETAKLFTMAARQSPVGYDWSTIRQFPWRFHFFRALLGSVVTWYHHIHAHLAKTCPPDAKMIEDAQIINVDGWVNTVLMGIATATCSTAWPWQGNQH